MTGKDWTMRDRGYLAHLLAEYGRPAVIEAAKTAPRARRRGYQRRDDEAQAALLDDIEWIERRADTYKNLGQAHGAIKRAVTDRFLMITPKGKQSDTALKQFADRVRNLRAQHARAEREVRAARQRRWKFNR